MWTGTVKGSVTATIKHPTMRKAKLLIVQPIHALSGGTEGFAQIVADMLGAGIGQRVLVSSDGPGAQRQMGVGRDCPVRLATIAILHDTSIQSRNAGVQNNAGVPPG